MSLVSRFQVYYYRFESNFGTANLALVATARIRNTVSIFEVSPGTSGAASRIIESRRLMVSLNARSLLNLAGFVPYLLPLVSLGHPARRRVEFGKIEIPFDAPAGKRRVVRHRFRDCDVRCNAPFPAALCTDDATVDRYLGNMPAHFIVAACALTQRVNGSVPRGQPQKAAR